MAYIFDPEEEESRKSRPAKRRRVSKQAGPDLEVVQNTSSFVPLLNGAESLEFVHLRDALFQESWSTIHDRIQVCRRLEHMSVLPNDG